MESKKRFPNRASDLAHAELNTLTGSLIKHYYIPNEPWAFGDYYFYVYARDNYVATPATTIPVAAATYAAETCTEKLHLHVCGPRDALTTLLVENTTAASVLLLPG